MMFKHSVKVPRLYKIAAKVARDVKEGLGSIKQLVYQNRSKHPNIKAIYALVATLFQRSDEIESLLKRSQFFVKEPRSEPWLTKVLIIELLWGKQCLPGNSKPEKTVLGYEQIFKAHLSDIPQSSNDSNLNTTEDSKPRYVRVNTLSMTVNEAIDGFRDEGWALSKFFDKADYQGFLDKITAMGEDEFLVDIHVPDLLIFPPKTQFYNHPAYKNGSIILQDKASCLPVHILAPPPGSIVLDMCASPGMKTTQVAAAIKNEGKIFAVERNPKRFETLSRIVESSGATCVTTVNKDVLTCSEKDFPGVEYILVDPSCSGSGIVGRLGFEQSKSNERIENLAGFQIKILRSALTRYPNAKRVVYSTCSTFSEENEDVVRQVLETNSNFKLVPAKKFVNDTWKNFGSSEFGDIGSYCLYAKPNEDFTNGFFVAVFERLEEGEENQFFNTKIYNFKKHMQSQENRKRKQQHQYQEVYGNSNYNSEISYNKDTHDNADVTNENRFDNFDDESNMSLGKKCKKNLNEFTENYNDESLNETIKTKEKKKKKKSKKSQENDSIVNFTKHKNTEDDVDVTNEDIFGNFDLESNSSREKKWIENQNEVTENDNDKLSNVIINTKQKKNKSKIVETNDVVNATKTDDELNNEIINTKEKKKKSKKIEENYINTAENDEAISVSERGGKHKKKKKDKNISEDIAEDNSHISVDPEDEKDTKKRKKSKKLSINDTDSNDISYETVLKKKKKKS